jgi:lysyl-tRNA synthetase class 2
MSGSEDGVDGSSVDEPGRHGLQELIAERRAKAERLRESDASAFPYAFPDAEPIAQILGAYAELDVGQETEDRHRVAGRLAARRGAGRAAFLDLVDRTGRIQLHARVDVLGKRWCCWRWAWCS